MAVQIRWYIENVMTRSSENGSALPVSEPLKGAALRVFEAARDLFYQRGIRAVGVEEIVVEAGVTKPSLYRNFASKDDLIVACLEQFTKEGFEKMDAVIDAAGDEPRDQLRAIIAYKAADMAQPGFRGCAISNTAVEFPEPGHRGRQAIEDCKIRFRERLVQLTRNMKSREPEALADGLILLIEGAYSTYHVFGSQGPGQSLVRAADALIDCYRPHAELLSEDARP
jgi:AcrR family transcriptional regulator